MPEHCRFNGAALGRHARGQRGHDLRDGAVGDLLLPGGCELVGDHLHQHDHAGGHRQQLHVLVGHGVGQQLRDHQHQRGQRELQLPGRADAVGVDLQPIEHGHDGGGALLQLSDGVHVVRDDVLGAGHGLQRRYGGLELPERGNLVGDQL